MRLLALLGVCLLLPTFISANRAEKTVLKDEGFIGSRQTNKLYTEKEKKPRSEMQQWMELNGAEFSKVEIDDKGILTTTETLHERDMILRIPKVLILGGTGEYPLLAYLLFELALGDESDYKPFIDTLIGRHLDTPIYWKDEEVDMLKGTWLFDRTIKDKEEIDKIYQNWDETIYGFPRPSLGEIAWAWITILRSSSQVLSAYEEEDGTRKFRPVLIPAISTLPYNLQKIDAAVDLRSRNGRVWVGNEFQAGTMIQGNLELLSTDELIRRHGIWFPHTSYGKNNIVKVELQLLPNDPYRAQKLTYLKDTPLSVKYPDSEIFHIKHNGLPSKEALAFLRIANFKFGQDLPGLPSLENVIAGRITAENEMNVMKNLLKMVADHRRRWTASFEIQKNKLNEYMSIEKPDVAKQREEMAMAIIVMELTIMEKLESWAGEEFKKLEKEGFNREISKFSKRKSASESVFEQMGIDKANMDVHKELEGTSKSWKQHRDPEAQQKQTGLLDSIREIRRQDRAKQADRASLNPDAPRERELTKQRLQREARESARETVRKAKFNVF